MYVVTRIEPIPQLANDSTITHYVYQAYVTDGSQIFVTGPEESVTKAREAGRELAKLHNRRVRRD